MKKFFVNVINWLRSRVTAIMREERRVKRENPNPEPSPVTYDQTPFGPHTAPATHDSTLLRAEEYITEHYHLRYNRLSREHELCEREGGAAAWKVLDEALCCTLLMEMQHAGIGLSKPYLVRTVVRGYKQVAHYHPVCSYLDALPQWDGHDHIGDLFRRITHDEQLLLWLRRWLLGMVAQVQGRLGRYGNSVCPLIISRQQGWGKSQFAKLIVPPELQMFFADTFNLAQEETCLRRMASYWLINVDELDRFSTLRMATLKNLVQLATITLKRPHRGQMEERQAQLWPATHVYDCLREMSPSAMEGIERNTFGWYLKEIGAQQVRVDNRRLWAVRKIANARG